jgi:hypothetical protein
VKVARKPDIRDIESIAAQFGMDPEARRDFGDFLEQCKRAGEHGTRNDRGDFTWAELEAKAREFLGAEDE